MDLATAPPAAAPSAPSSAPSPAPAPVSAPAPTPAPAAAPASAPASSPSEPDTRSIHDRLLEGWNKAKASVPVEAPPDEHPALAPAEGGEELPAPGAEPADEHPAAAPAEEAPVVAPVEPAPAADALPALDDGTSWTAEDIAALDQSLGDNPDKSRIMSAIRRDGETREIRQIFPTKEAAQEAAQGAALYQAHDSRFLQATTKEGAQEFLNGWVRESMLTDDAGKPLLDQNGKYQFHPALFSTLNHILDNRMGVIREDVARTGQLPAVLNPVFDALSAKAKATGNERLGAALDIIREVTEGPPSPAGGDVPEELRPYAESVKTREQEVKAREDALNRQQRDQANSQNQQAIERVETKVFDTLHGQLKPLIAKASLSKFEEGAALEKIGNLLEERLNQHPMYNPVRQSILSRPPSEARDAALTKHDLTYMQEFLGPIAARVMTEAKGGSIARQTARQTQVAGQARQSQTEPRGTTITAPRTQPQNPQQLRAQIVADYKAANNGSEPEEDFVRGQILKRTTLPQLRR